MSLQGKFKMLRRSIGLVLVLLIVLADLSCVSQVRSQCYQAESIDLKKTDDSYVLLVAPKFESADHYAVQLLNLYGRPVHQWMFDQAPYLGRLVSEDNLLVSFMVEDDSAVPGLKVTGLIAEYDWEGKLIWSHRDNLMHHDFIRLSNGHTSYLAWKRIPKNIAYKIKGGIPKTEFDGDIWGDVIREVNTKGEVIWQWESFKYLDTQKYELSKSDRRREWTHMNSIAYTDSNPINGTPAYLLSSRRLSTVFIIEKESKKILWESPRGLFVHQHDASFDGQNIMVFDNGINSSRIVVVDPKSNNLVWEYKGSQRSSKLYNYQFYSYITSGVQRLSNGNIHITMGVPGIMLEVTSDKERVWYGHGPVNKGDIGWPYGFLFKTFRYKLKDETKMTVSKLQKCRTS